MSVFEPKTIAAILRNSSLIKPGEREKFKTQWTQSVKSRVEKWKNLPTSKACERPLFQLEWEAEIVEYVTLLWNNVRCRSTKSTAMKTLGYDVPIIGPRFVPPSYLHSRLRPGSVNVNPETQYLKPINIIHPLYYPELACCPRCGSCDKVTWEGWTTTGARELHGVAQEEAALGLQLRCENCKRDRASNQDIERCDSEPTAESGDATTRASTWTQRSATDWADEKKDGYCFALTSQAFWKKWNHWGIPDGIPIFFKRCGLTRELFNLIIELRPATTSAGLAERFKQLHLLEYYRRKWEYLKALETEHVKMADSPGLAKFGTANVLKAFSAPDNPQGYADRSISHEIVTEVFLDFNGRTRQVESESYLRSLPTRCGSMDSTFKSASKATITDHHRQKSRELRGGILSMLNEKGEIVAWRLCQTKANAEMTELLAGIRRRHEILGLPMPEMMVTDNCCQVRSAVQSILPETDCVLDVWHFIARYIAVILNASKNAYRAAVAVDITNAILKTRSVKGSGAEYWDKVEQEQKLEAAFSKWAAKGTVWSAAAMQVHQEQLKHVRKGCLERCRQDILSDGSRIEGSHKGWNSLQHAQPSGVTVLTALGHDFVLRRNIRVAYASLSESGPESPFLHSTNGSHHVGLIAAIAILHNRILKNTRGLPSTSITATGLPELSAIDSNEIFGLTTSDHTSTFGGLIHIKEELTTELDDGITTLRLFEQDTTADLAIQASRAVLEELHIDPSLLDQPCEGEAASHLDVKTASRTVTTGPLVKALPTTKRKVESLAADETTPNSSNKDVDATSPGMNPSLGDALPIPKRARLDPPLVSDPDVASAVALPGRLDYYFKTSGSSSSTATDIPKPKSTISMLPSDPTEPTVTPSLPAHAANTATATHLMAVRGSVHALATRQSDLVLPRFRADGLTRSQRLFSLATNIDPRSLTIQEDGEFYLFMEMRAEFKWVSHEMNPKRWVEAAAEFNKRLVAKRGPSAVIKNPLALLRTLGELEPKLMNRIVKGEYKSKRNSEEFWKRHCDAVNLIKPEAEKKTRKAQTCSRCKTIMYPGPEGSALNHKKGYCSDGVKQLSKVEEIPPWPQPQGIFTAGKTFHPQAFYLTVQDIYERYCTIRSEPTPIATMEALAFVQLLASRIRTFDDGSMGLRLFSDYELDERTPSGYVFSPEDKSGKFLRVPYLQQGAF